jgi:hypothetical protein
MLLALSLSIVELEEVYQPKRAEISLINYCSKNKLLKALWVYCILRDKGYNHGGYSPKVQSIGGLSRSRTYAYIKILRELGWVEVNENYYKAVSIHKIVESLGLKGRSAVEIIPDAVRDFSFFENHCFAAQVESLLRMQANMTMRAERTWKDSPVSDFVDRIFSNGTKALTRDEFKSGVFFHKQGQLSVRMILHHLGYSLGGISGKMRTVESTGYAQIIPEWLRWSSVADAKELVQERLIIYYEGTLASTATRCANTVVMKRTYTKKRFNPPTKRKVLINWKHL